MPEVAAIERATRLAIADYRRATREKEEQEEARYRRLVARFWVLGIAFSIILSGLMFFQTVYLRDLTDRNNQTIEAVKALTVSIAEQQRAADANTQTVLCELARVATTQLDYTRRVFRRFTHLPPLPRITVESCPPEDAGP